MVSEVPGALLSLDEQRATGGAHQYLGVQRLASHWEANNITKLLTQIQGFIWSPTSSEMWELGIFNNIRKFCFTPSSRAR